jgi:hypothetical protein
VFELLEPIVEIFGDAIIQAVCEHFSAEVPFSNVDFELPPTPRWRGATSEFDLLFRDQE